MKVIMLFFVLFILAGCTTIGAGINKVVSPADSEFGTKMQAKKWRDFKKMLDEYNKTQSIDGHIGCEPRKRDNGRFTYIHCEFGKGFKTLEVEKTR
ncbi:MAG: hypothetical protein AAF465_15880 [Pseudomonadota bacterium]